jgi:hypothetical protein
LLTAQPLFMSADPAQQDADWLLFQQGDFASLFQQKSNLCSPIGLDFIFRLLNIDPSHRMSIADALNHQWLKDPKISPVLAPKEFLPESLRKKLAEKERNHKASAGLVDSVLAAGTRAPVASTGGGGSASVFANGGSSNLVPSGGASPGGSAWAPPGGGLPSWNAANLAHGQGYSANPVPHTPVLRVRSPPRSLRSGPGASRTSEGRMYIATAHSPPPHARSSGAAARSPSPMQQAASPTSYAPSAMYRTASPAGFPSQAPESRFGPPQFVTPRSTSRTSSGMPPYALLGQGSSPHLVEDAARGRGPQWTFQSDGSGEAGETNSAVPRLRASSPGGATPFLPATATRTALSPGRSLYVQRSTSPGQLQQGMPRAASPGVGITFKPSLGGGGGGFSWAQAPAFSPRPSHHMSSQYSGSAGPRTASPVAARYLAKTGFAWSPEPPSPRTSPRTMRGAPP